MNNIYPGELVTSLLVEIGAANICNNKRKWFIKTNRPTLFQSIINVSANIDAPSFNEQLYCYVTGTTERPKCKLCDKNVKFGLGSRFEYLTFCSNKCAIKDMPNLLGVENPSKLQSVKDKKKQKSLEKYGVDNVSKSTEIKQELKKKRFNFWKNYYSSKEFTVDGLTKTQYRHRCQQYANTQYNRFKDIIDPLGLRSKEWHLDHIYSVSDGFKNGVPYNILSDISNLRLISAQENLKKWKKSEKILPPLIEHYLKNITDCPVSFLIPASHSERAD